MKRQAALRALAEGENVELSEAQDIMQKLHAMAAHARRDRGHRPVRLVFARDYDDLSRWSGVEEEAI